MGHYITLEDLVWLIDPKEDLKIITDKGAIIAASCHIGDEQLRQYYTQPVLQIKSIKQGLKIVIFKEKKEEVDE